MNQADALDIVQSALWTVIVASGPAVGAAMAIGIVIALLQALTQVQEMTLTFIPKIIAILVICSLTAPFIGAVIYCLRRAGVRPHRGRVLGPPVARGTRASRKLHRPCWRPGKNSAATMAYASSIKPVESKSGQDVGFALGIVFILTVLFLPLPAWMIDIGLAFSIALSVLILMVALWIQRPLDFSAFPTVLLIATLLRLSLNIATTRLILSNGAEGYDAAGHVIAGFANFVMSGDFVIGTIVFVILITVNFLVITKGATRIAEVGARFTLDAIPGKQMAIDADLNGGLIDDKEATRRRRELEEESAFFGSMDGASKFVRGDAIAGLIITAVNVFGGIIIGVTRHDMSPAARPTCSPSCRSATASSRRSRR